MKDSKNDFQVTYKRPEGQQVKDIPRAADTTKVIKINGAVPKVFAVLKKLGLILEANFGAGQQLPARSGRPLNVRYAIVVLRLFLRTTLRAEGEDVKKEDEDFLEAFGMEPTQDTKWSDFYNADGRGAKIGL